MLAFHSLFLFVDMDFFFLLDSQYSNTLSLPPVLPISVHKVREPTHCKLFATRDELNSLMTQRREETPFFFVTNVVVVVVLTVALSVVRCNRYNKKG